MGDSTYRPTEPSQSAIGSRCQDGTGVASSTWLVGKRHRQLVTFAYRPAAIAAVVSRGGRPDLAGGALARVEAPTLLIVGGYDEPVIELNREAMRQMHAHVELEIVPGATHLFEELGTLDEVADLAASWFARYLRAAGSRRA
jgi:pimeloyl-ACP methyl ester carboxylesterase